MLSPKIAKNDDAYPATALLAGRDSYQPCHFDRSVLVATAPIDRESHIYQKISSCR